MENSWKDRTSLKRKIVESKKQQLLDMLLSNTLGVEETEKLIEKVVHCNKILFELQMYEKNENFNQNK